MQYRPEYDPIEVGKNLRRLRKAKNLTVDYVREYLRLGSTQAIYKYENGQSYPQADTMFALMELYEATLYDITGRPAVAAAHTREEDRERSSSVISANFFNKFSRFAALLKLRDAI